VTLDISTDTGTDQTAGQAANTWPMADLLPHAGNAILIDAIQAWDEESLVATATVAPDGLYSLEDGSLPPWMGLEIMAQTIGAWAGCQARRAGQPIELGFLLGTRRYDCHVPCFAAGTQLTVRVEKSLEDAAGMGVFACTLHAGGALLAEARLNVYRPPDSAAFIHEESPSNDEPTS
jgi:predicted hotdog family 3-hydroxylacyl-ACP dehydratase